MQLGHLSTVQAASPMVEGRFKKITSICWSSNNLRFAVSAAQDRFVRLYDENGVSKDGFNTKPASSQGPRNYTITGLAFSPDGSKLAIAQSDNIVFVYKLGHEWGERKSICNKFPETEPVTCICWPSQRKGELVYGLANGQIKVGITKRNKAAALYNTDSYVTTLAPSPDGDSFLSAHVNGCVYRYTFPDPDGRHPPSQALLVTCDYVPYSLGWGEQIVISGNTQRVQFYMENGALSQEFDFRGDESVKEFSCAAFHPSGQSVVLGNFDGFFVFSFNSSKNCWQEPKRTKVPNLLTVTSLCWKPDGSKLSTGALCGAVDFFDACLRRFRLQGKFEVTYTSLSSLMIMHLATGARTAVKSDFGLEITKVNVYHDRYVVCHTSDTLILGDMDTRRISEVQWRGTGSEKFVFDTPCVCMVYHAGELSLVEYGEREFLGSCRTEHMSPHYVSVCVYRPVLRDEAGNRVEPNPRDVVKKIAFLLDVQAIRVLDLRTAVAEATHNHESRIDWLELNHRGTKLLFRDKRRSLHLLDIATQERTTLLNFCTYAQWVPDSDVVVAQSRQNLCVWYSIENTDDMALIPVKGNAVQIVRQDGQTEVLCEEGIKQGQGHTAYPLNEALIAFGTAANARDKRGAIEILEKLPLSSPGVEGMWTELSRIALEDNDLFVAQRCYAALGDVSKAQYLQSINKIVQSTPAGMNHYLVRAKLAILNKQFKRAEAIFVEQGKIDEAFAMYQKLHKWEDAISLAKSRGQHHVLPQLRTDYFNYLLATRQEEVAGKLKEDEGDYMGALELYLKGGFPSRAANLVHQYGFTQDVNLLEDIANALFQKKQYEKAGEFLEKLNQPERALEAYRRARAYKQAVRLARRDFRDLVVRLEEEWGDWLVSQKQMDAASHHYMEIGNYVKAVDAAMEAGNMRLVVKIIDYLEPDMARPYLRKIAKQFEDQKKYEAAEKYYVQGGFSAEAVHMYLEVGLGDKARAVAATFMSESEIASLYISHAQEKETQGKFEEAEKLYLAGGRVGQVIDMYKRNRRWDKMLQTVTEHRPEVLPQTHSFLANQYLTDGNLKQAEAHFCKYDWKQAANMYRQHEMQSDALRVAKTHGGLDAYKQEAYFWAKRVGFERGVKLLEKLDLSTEAVKYAVERGEFNEAFTIAKSSCPNVLQEIHYQYAVALEDEARFEKAEEEFVISGKPVEAVKMYLYQKEWMQAMRVAEKHDPSAISLVYEAQGEQSQEQKQYKNAEQYYLEAGKPELAVKMYEGLGMFDDAERVSSKHAPALLSNIELKRATSADPSNPVAFILSQAKLAESKQSYSAAIDHYLKLTDDKTDDWNQLEQVWERAVTLALDHVHNRINEVVDVVCNRLIQIQLFEAAARVYESVDANKEAITAYMKGSDFESALRVARDREPQMEDYVRKAHENYLIQQGQVDKLPGSAALDVLINQGDWAEAHKLAAEQNDSERVASLHAKAQVQAKDYLGALDTINKYDLGAIASNFDMYKRVALECLNMLPEVDEDSDDNPLADPAYELPGQQGLRQMLYRVVMDLRDTGSGSKADQQRLSEFTTLLMTTHFSSMRISCIANGLNDLACKVATSLLRYTDLLPVDKTFHDAGQLSRAEGKENHGFVFLNRFVEFIDLVGDADGRIDDNTDFLSTDIPSPYDVAIPEARHFSEEYTNDILNWVLEFMATTKVKQEVSMRSCENCKQQTYEAALCCHHCQARVEPCIITGYPVLRSQHVECQRCHRPANREDWNKYLRKANTCPWCGTVQHPVY